MLEVTHDRLENIKETCVSHKKCVEESVLSENFILFTKCGKTDTYAHLVKNETCISFSFTELENFFVHLQSIIR